MRSTRRFDTRSAFGRRRVYRRDTPRVGGFEALTGASVRAGDISSVRELFPTSTAVSRPGSTVHALLPRSTVAFLWHRMLTDSHGRGARGVERCSEVDVDGDSAGLHGTRAHQSVRDGRG